jgi:acetylornithine deacetylase/succinyl-diaminopimelate desuccinylase-like protein
MEPLGQLHELLRIPSVAGDDLALARAVRWVCSVIKDAGGTVECERWSGVPLGVGTIPASDGRADAPTVLLYGHVDVQPVAHPGQWASDPFEPTIRDGWLYARGAADDKGPFFALLRAASELAGEQRLPVNVRVLCDTEEESGGSTAVRFLAADTARMHACVIFDTALHAARQPVLVLATRGIASMRVHVRTAADDVHSGVFGGIAGNAAHVLLASIDALTEHDSRPVPALWAGVSEPAPSELESWERIDVSAMLTAAGLSGDVDAIGALRRMWAEPAVDVHGFSAGLTSRELNIVPAAAETILSIRVAPGQDVMRIGASVQALLQDAAPEWADMIVTPGSRTPAAGPFDPDEPVIAAARGALEAGFGVAPVLARSGGSLPILAALGERGIATAVSGLALPDSHIHGTDERLRIDHLELGVRAARELLLAWDESVLLAATR